ncbi:hypothetical protein [Nocardia sp. NBC_01009]|uniref:hypothetical protein n=1 Tax=Nocardia sp. NBC_01009 TaxID=2975996 RepID=UPI00386C39C6|nr:hypothetical protein OHA42_20870 [Nocardia sp. NBC_01009]
MATEDLRVIVEGLLTLGFPTEDARDGNRSSGPGHHVCVLRASQDFWNDRSEEVVEAAEEEIGAAFQELVTVLTARWGGPEAIDLGPFLWCEGPVPEPISRLCGLSGEMLVWRQPEAGRWVALTVGQGDPELPIELLVAVGEEPIPELESSDHERA